MRKKENSKNLKKESKQQLQLEKQEWSKLFNIQKQQSFLESPRLLDHETFIKRFKSREAPVTDAQLMQECINSNEKAFNELYRRYHSNMLAYVSAIIKDEDEAQDVLQDAWMVVLESISNGNCMNIRDFATWFKSTCYRTARQWKLEKQRFMHGNENMPDKPDTSFNAEQRLINAETEMLLYKASNLLDEQDRLLFILRAYEGRSFYEIAVILHLNVNTARSIYFRIMKRIKQAIAEV